MRVYHVPRFATPRLVADATVEDLTDMVYPYGGAHLGAQDPAPGLTMGLRQFARQLPAWLGHRAVVAAAVLVPLLLLAIYVFGRIESRRAADHTEAAAPSAAAVPAGPFGPTAPPPPPPPPPAARPVPAPPPVVAQALSPKPDEPATTYTRFSSAKQAYRDGKIDKTEYKRIVRELRESLEQELERAKRDYQEGRISRTLYQARMQEIKRSYR